VIEIEHAVDLLSVPETLDSDTEEPPVALGRC